METVQSYFEQLRDTPPRGPGCSKVNINCGRRSLHSVSPKANEICRPSKGGTVSTSKFEPLPRFDIFRTETEGVLWLESATTLESAKARVEQIAGRSPGEYLLLNQVTGDKVIFRPGLSDIPTSN